MIKRILVIVLFTCKISTAIGQDFKSRVSETYKNDKKIGDKVRNAFAQEPILLKKEAIFNKFFNGKKGNESSFEFLKRALIIELAELNASENKVAASTAWIAKIKDERGRMDATRLAAAAYGENGNIYQSVNMLKPILDSLLNQDMTIKQDGINLYTSTVTVYSEILSGGYEKEILHYLKPLYEFNSNYFPSDIARRLAKPDLDPRTQLFYLFAKAIPQTDVTEIANVISLAFRMEAVPKSMQADVLEDFSTIPELEKSLRQINQDIDNKFERNVIALLSKTDINGKVWGTALKGKYLLIDFWGSWCIPCRFTHPHLKELYEKYKSRGFEIVGLSMETSADLKKAKESWKKAVNEDAIEWIHLLNNENSEHFNAVKEFNIGTFPTKILLDKEGKEIARYVGGSSTSLDETLKEIFGF